ncbi:MAG: hypothetical protein ACK5L7_02840, partial [Paludibacteraceae bacterium]
KVMQQDDSIQIYTAVVKAVAMKRTVRVVVVNYVENRKPTTKIYFSTNCRLNVMEILDIYKTRFQIEFLYRDAKQHTALNHNALLLDRFMAMFAVRPNILKNSRNVKELILYGTKCASSLTKYWE